MKIRRIVSIAAVACIVAAFAAPAMAKGGNGHGKGQGKGHKGKRAIGVVFAVDATTRSLTVTMNDGSEFTGTVAEDAKIKLEHRGKPTKAGNPTTGDFSSIEVGTKVLKLKTNGTEVTKLRLRAANSTVEDAPGGEDGLNGEDEDEGEDDAEVGDPTPDGAELDPDDSGADGSDGSDGSGSDGSSSDGSGSDGSTDGTDCLDDALGCIGGSLP